MDGATVIRQDTPNGPRHIYLADDGTGGSVALCGYHASAPLSPQTIWPNPDEPPAGLCPLCDERDRTLEDDE
jgi:hypothetical protein